MLCTGTCKKLRLALEAGVWSQCGTETFILECSPKCGRHHTRMPKLMKSGKFWWKDIFNAWPHSDMNDNISAKAG